MYAIDSGSQSANSPSAQMDLSKVLRISPTDAIIPPFGSSVFDLISSPVSATTLFAWHMGNGTSFSACLFLEMDHMSIIEIWALLEPFRNSL